MHIQIDVELLTLPTNITVLIILINNAKKIHIVQIMLIGKITE